MGAAESSAFPFKVGQEVPEFQHQYWKLYEGTKSANGEPVSILTFQKKGNENYTALAQNYLQRLRTLRHPHILRFIDGIELPTALHIVTEPVMPFVLGMKDDDDHKDAGGDESSGRPRTRLTPVERKKVKEMAITLGLHQLVSAISWVNNDAKMIHGNIHQTSIFITKGGDWKLGGFDVITSQNQLSDVFKAYQQLPGKYQPPEYADRQWTVIQKGPTSAIDAWCTGCLIFECFNDRFYSADDLSRLNNIPAAIHPEYKRLLHTSGPRRLNPKTLLDSQLFQNPLVECVTFVDELALKSAAEKEKFFEGFSAHLSNLPQRYLKYKILPLLINALEYGSGMSCFATILSSVLKIGGMLNEEEYTMVVIPSVVKLFSSNERAVRVNLLQHLKDFSDSLDKDLVNKQIFPHVVSGFSDPLPLLRELTVKSMTYFVPKLSKTTVDTQVLRFLAQCQGDKIAAIRTNTTYCLAKIAPHLSETSRQKVLIPGFTRALKDGFPPARQAALVSFGVTINYYAPPLCAQQILPVVAPFLVDPVNDVRQAAAQCCHALMGKVQKYQVELDQKDQQAAVAGAAAGAPGAGKKAADDNGYAAMVGSVASWAVSSVSKQVSSRLNAGTPTTNKPDPGAHPKATMSSGNQVQGTGASGSTVRSGDTRATLAAPKSSEKAQTAAGWDDDFFGDDDDGEAPTAVEFNLSLSTKSKAEKKKPVRASRPTARSNSGSSATSAARKTSGASKSSILSDSSVGADLDADLDAWGAGSSGMGEALKSNDDDGGWGDTSGWGEQDDILGVAAAPNVDSDDGFGDLADLDPLSDKPKQAGGGKSVGAATSGSRDIMGDDWDAWGASPTASSTKVVVKTSKPVSRSSSSGSIGKANRPNATVLKSSPVKKSASKSTDEDWESFLNS